MTENRVIDIAESGAHLHVETGNLVLDLEDAERWRCPVDDLAAISISHPRVSVSKSALAACAIEGICLVVYDDKYMPVGMMLPLQSHYLQAERFARQATASLPTRKRLWQQVVRAKIETQARLLEELRWSDSGIRELVSRVRSGDPTNVEAQAARRYWPSLMGQWFSRDRYGPWPNPMLNYGYAILRAITARAVVTAGLHPSLGLHHHNRYDAFCLADDLMEPFRPIVDRAVVSRVEREGDVDRVLRREDRAMLIGELYKRIEHEGESRTLFDVLSRMALSLVDVYTGTGTALVIPVP
ncbi:MAG: type II CRISPR-associated endonuclease Cas1 [Acidimicrobiales bacterium]